MEPISIDDSITGTKVTRDKKRRWHQLLADLFYEFAENTTLNGLKYIAEEGASILERLFWSTTFVISISLCLIMVYKSYVKYDTSGVVVTLKEHLVSVNEYPFPAVTICPQARIRQTRYNYTLERLYMNYRPEDTTADFKKLHATMVLCDNDDGINASNTSMILNHTIDMKVFYEVAPKQDDIFEMCIWQNKLVDCEKIFRPVLTADGVCFTFNTLATNDIFRKKSVYQKRYYLNSSTSQKGWSLEENYYSSANGTFPRRGRANGAVEDLFISLNEIKDRDFACDTQTRPGYKVYFHHPAHLPQAFIHSYAAQPGKTTSFAIKLDILDTAAELAGYAPNIRQCYFPNERYLQFFQKYTSLNCQLECLTNYTVKVCKCASFYMPRNSSIPICKGNDWRCIYEALDQYAAEGDLNESEISQCRCLPSCKDVNYDADIVITKLDLKEFFKKIKELVSQGQVGPDIDYNGDSDKECDEDCYETQTNGYNIEAVNETDDVTSDNETDVETPNKKFSHDETPTEETFTEIRIYYRRSRFVAMERSEMVGLSQFLADVGGTLGLFLGFSVLTLAEIFYFFSIKLCCRLKHKNLQKRETSKDIEKTN